MRCLLFVALLCVSLAARAEDYPGATSIPIGTGGLSTFQTQDGLLSVARHFQQRFERNGWPTVHGGDFREEAWVAGLETREGIQHLVLVRRGPEGTRVWVSEQAGQVGTLPLLGVPLATSEQSQEAEGLRTWFLPHALPAAREALVAVMEKAGYRLREERVAAPTHLLVHERGGRVLFSWIASLQPQLSAVLQADVPGGSP